jgi:hypothetical protein
MESDVALPARVELQGDVAAADECACPGPPGGRDRHAGARQGHRGGHGRTTAGAPLAIAAAGSSVRRRWSSRSTTPVASAAVP